MFFEPNPARNYITLNVAPQKVNVFDLNASLVLLGGQGDKVLDISNLKNGVYLVKMISTEGKYYVNRLIKR